MLYMEILFLKTKRKNYLKGSKRMILKCENLKKSYGDFCAIRKINYSFTPGVYGLLGPSGAGTSTWMITNVEYVYTRQLKANKRADFM